MQVLYTAHATATGDGRDGHTRSDDGVLDLEVRMPVEMGGTGGATNPEQLFAGGWAACFHSALKVAAGRDFATVEDSSVTAHVGLGTYDDGRFGLKVEIDVHLPNAVDHTAGTTIVNRAHEICPYSNATRGNIDVAVRVV